MEACIRAGDFMRGTGGGEEDIVGVVKGGRGEDHDNIGVDGGVNCGGR